MSKPRVLLKSAATRLGLIPRPPIVIQLGKDGEKLRSPRKLQHFHGEQFPPDQTHWRMPAHIDWSRRAWLRTLRSLYDQPLSFPTSLSPEAGLLLHSIVLNHRPRVCLEIGCNIGISTLWIAGALVESGQGRMFCFDDFGKINRSHGLPGQPTDRHEFFLDQLRSAEVSDRITVTKGLSPDTVLTRQNEIVAAGRAGGHAGSSGLQFAFIDGDHTPAGVMRDFLAVEPMLDTGALVVLHDTFPFVCGWTGPRQLLNTLHEVSTGTYQVLDLFLSPVNYGLAVLRRIG